MTLPLTPDIIINELQQKFQEEYAYLHLKFFKTLSQGEGLSTIKKFCDPSKKLGSEVLMKKSGTINISDDMTVQELVEKFYTTFGIHVQVFRKSANLWMEITLTSNWSLRQQNSHGKEISI